MPRYYGRRKYLSIHVVMNALLCLSNPVRGGYAVAVTTFRTVLITMATMVVKIEAPI